MNSTHESFHRNEKVKPGSNRSFGVVFSIVFFAISVSPIFFSHFMRFGFLALSVILLAFALLDPARLTEPNRYWTRLGVILSKITSPIILGVVFFAVVLPVGLLLRLFRKDVLSLKWHKSYKSYWINSAADISSMKDQF